MLFILINSEREKGETHDVRVLLKTFQDTSSRERFLPEPRANITQDSSLESIILVEKILESRIGRAETVEEVLRKDPTAVGVSAFLCRELRVSFEERVVGEYVWQMK